MNLFVKRKINIPRSKFYPTATLFEKAGQQFLSQRERERERESKWRRVSATVGSLPRNWDERKCDFSLLFRDISIYIYIQIRSIVCAKKESLSRLKIAGPSAYLGRPNKLA